MNLIDSLTVALEALVANKMRSVLTMLGVIIGVGAVITMMAVAKGATGSVVSNIQAMGTNVLFVMSGQSSRNGVRTAFGSNQTLKLEDADALLKKCPSVAAVAPEADGTAQVKYRNQNTSTSITGTTPSYFDVRNFKVQDGRFFNDRDVKGVKTVAVIGPTTSTDLFGDDSPIGKVIRIRGINFTIIGETVSKGASGPQDNDDQIFIPISTSMRRVFGTLYIRMINVQAKSADLTTVASDEMTTLLHKRHHIAAGADDDFSIRNMADMLDTLNEVSAALTLLLGGIASVSLIVGGIGIMNIMMVSVTERTREIGIRMALGARRSDIQWQFLVEAFVLSVLGGILGILIGMLGASIIGYVSKWDTGVSMLSVVLSFSFAALVGIGFGFYPAWKASRLDPIDALRYE